MAQILNLKHGLPKSFWKVRRNCEFFPPHGSDSPDLCLFGEYWWNHYPTRSYSYRYNSWSFRGNDFEQYAGQKVNICLGDSMTVNIGGPIEHSWPYQLGQLLGETTLNCGLDKLSFELFPCILEKLRAELNVDKVFIQWNLFDLKQPSIRSIVSSLNQDASARAKILKSFCWIPDAYWQFDPPWSFEQDELRSLYEHFPNAHDYMKLWHQSIDKSQLPSEIYKHNDHLKNLYNSLRGESWMSFDDICKLVDQNRDLTQTFTEEIDQQLAGHIWMCAHDLKRFNRDGFHMSQSVHTALARYFFQQVKKSAPRHALIVG